MKRIEFKVGQKVVCINTSSLVSTKEVKPKLIKGKIYTVNSIIYCGQCGTQKVDVGLIIDVSGVVCCCGFVLEPTARWAASQRFAPIDNLSESIEEAVSNEDYELAQTLTEVAQEQLIHTLL